MFSHVHVLEFIFMLFGIILFFQNFATLSHARIYNVTLAFFVHLLKSILYYHFNE